MKNDIDENKEKEVIQKAYHYNKFLVIWFIAVFIILVLRITKIRVEFYSNEKNLTNNDGSLKVASDGNGSTESVATHNATTDALGISEYDVTGNFDMSVIDKAIEKVSSQRAETGAQTNGVESALTYNSHAAMELNGYQMDKEEEKVTKALEELKTKQALDSYQAILQKQRQEDEQQKSMAIFA